MITMAWPKQVIWAICYFGIVTYEWGFCWRNNEIYQLVVLAYILVHIHSDITLEVIESYGVDIIKVMIMRFECEIDLPKLSQGVASHLFLIVYFDFVNIFLFAKKLELISLHLV